MRSKLSFLIRSLLIICLIFIASTKVKDSESKIFNDNINKKINLSTMAQKIEENIANDIYVSKDTFSGDLTGYIYNCPMCSGRLACKYDYDLSDGKTFYPDEMYGNVRIVASSSNLSCGTIVRFNFSRVSSEPIVAIVLDRGVRGNALDLLTENFDAARTLGRGTITYDVLREGFGS